MSGRLTERLAFREVNGEAEEEYPEKSRRRTSQALDFSGLVPPARHDMALALVVIG